MLQRLSGVARLFVPTLSRRPSYPMSDRWKEREDAAENMYITQKEKAVLKRLLKQLKDNDDIEDPPGHDAALATQVKNLLTQYGYTSQPLADDLTGLATVP